MEEGRTRELVGVGWKKAEQGRQGSTGGAGSRVEEGRTRE